MDVYLEGDEFRAWFGWWGYNDDNDDPPGWVSPSGESATLANVVFSR